MRNLSSFVSLAAVLVAASAAFAEPEVRDHRAPTVAPVADTQVRHYRKRPGPGIMMPLRVDFGAAGANTSAGFAGGAGMSVGIHWASLSPRPTDTDVGIGLFGAILGAPGTGDTMKDEKGVAYGGAYLELGQTLAKGSFWRTWASGRGEYLGSTAFGNDHAGFGASGRLSTELYVSGVGIEPRGVFLGTYAIGLYVEAGVRDTVDGLSAFQMGGGITFRTPLVFGF